jgi:hypothetical protein
MTEQGYGGLRSGCYVIPPKPATPQSSFHRVWSLTLAGPVGKLTWARTVGQVTEEEYRQRRRLLDLYDGFGWMSTETAVQNVDAVEADQ